MIDTDQMRVDFNRWREDSINANGFAPTSWQAWQAVTGELQAEIDEQARLLGMSAERELSLLAQIDQLKRKVDGLERAVFLATTYG